jgi:hypothetical protein
MTVFAVVAKGLEYPVKGFGIPVDHYAVFNDETETVIHNSPDNPGVMEVSLQSFWDKYFSRRYNSVEAAMNAGALVVVPASDASASRTIWQRAKQKVGQAYDKASYNCEHFTRWCFEGTAMSTQVQNAVRIGVGAVGIGGLAAYGAYKLFKWLSND